MWNQFRTDEYEGMLAETMNFVGYNGDMVNSYYTRPLGPGPFPGVVLIHHMPGWDELYREIARRFTQHGYIVICPNLYSRFGYGTPEEVSARVREQGGVPDDRLKLAVAADGRRRHLTYAGKIGQDLGRFFAKNGQEY